MAYKFSFVCLVSLKIVERYANYRTMFQDLDPIAVTIQMTSRVKAPMLVL